MKRYAYTAGDLGSVLETRSYTYNAGTWNDRLTGFNGHSVTSDSIGNMTSYLGNTYTWNGRELAKIQGNGNTFTYACNAEGIRTKKTVNGTATEYFLNGSQILAEKTGDTVTWFFYDSQGTRIGMVYGSNIYYYLYNLQGDGIN